MENNIENSNCLLCGKRLASCICDTIEKFAPGSDTIKLSTTQEVEAHGQDHELRGKILDKKFRIVDRLGAGALATVFSAEHLYLQKKVAIKLFSTLDDETKRSISRIQREAAILASVSHPNVVDVMDLGITPEGTPYIVQEFIEGTDLGAILENEGSLVESRCLNLFAQICDGIDFLHKQGIIHRDLKPANIIVFVNDFGIEQVKIIDLGIAKQDNPGGAMHTFTTTGNIFGSPFYMSPEHCSGENIEFRSDIYSLGCLMYEALAGSPPFHGYTIMETLNKHLNEEPVSINNKKPKKPVSAALDKLILSCLEKQIENRPQSCGDLTSKFNSLRINKKVFSPYRLAMVAAVLLISIGLFLNLFKSMQTENLNGSGDEEPKIARTSSDNSITSAFIEAIYKEEDYGSKQAKNNYYQAYRRAVNLKSGPELQCVIASDIARLELKERNLSEVEKLFKRWSPYLKRYTTEHAYKMKTDTNFSTSFARFYYIAGRSASLKRNWTAAETRLKNGLAVAKWLPEKNFVSQILNLELGYVLVHTNRVHDGLLKLHEVLEQMNQIPGQNVRIASYIQRTCQYLADGYEKQDEYKKAAQILKYGTETLRANGMMIPPQMIARIENLIERSKTPKRSNSKNAKSRKKLD